MVTLLLIILIILVGVLLIVVTMTLRRKPQNEVDISTPLAVLAEKISSLTDRIAQVEKSHDRTDAGIGEIVRRQIETGTRSESLTNKTNEIHLGLSSAVNNLTALDARLEERREIDRQTADSVKKLETVIAGTNSKGVAGENILEAMFANLPDEWLHRNFPVGGRRVEYAFRLQNNLVLPIDSKLAATDLLKRFVDCNDSNEKQKLKSEIERTVRDKANEVKKYLDPALTVDFGIAVVPDAIYDLCCGIRTDVFKSKVLLVSYSMLVPYLLLVHHTHLKASQNIDLKKLGTALHTAEESISAIQEVLEKHHSDAITRLANSRNIMREHLSKVRSALISVQINSDAQEQPAILSEPDLLNLTETQPHLL